MKDTITYTEGGLKFVMRVSPPLPLGDLAYRYAKPDDFAAMYANCFAEAPQDKNDPTYRQIKHEWDLFTNWPTAVTFVVEDRTRHVNRVCGCGQMVFITEAFADRIRKTTVPGVNREASENNRANLLNLPELRKANSAKGVNGLLTRWHSGTTGLFPEAFRAQVRAVLYRGMMTCFLGYKYLQIFGETYGAPTLQYAQEAGFSVLSEYADFYATAPPHTPRFGMVHITRELAAQREASRVSQLFTDYRVPRLHLNEASQQLLRLAVLGCSDGEIARLVGLRLKSIWVRWQALSALERHNALVRQIVKGASMDRSPTDLDRKGADRHAWIQFAVQHPEELRPHDGAYFKKHIKQGMYQSL